MGGAKSEDRAALAETGPRRDRSWKHTGATRQHPFDVAVDMAEPTFEVRAGQAELSPARSDLKSRLRQVPCARWLRCASEAELWEAGPGQALGDPPFGLRAPFSAGRPSMEFLRSWSPRRS